MRVKLRVYRLVNSRQMYKMHCGQPMITNWTENDLLMYNQQRHKIMPEAVQKFILVRVIYW